MDHAGSKSGPPDRLQGGDQIGLQEEDHIGDTRPPLDAAVDFRAYESTVVDAVCAAVVTRVTTLPVR